MKKLILLICLFVNVLTLFGQKPIHGKVIIFVDPTLSKLKDITSLVENKCIDIPDLKIIGLYNIHQDINIDESKEFIRRNKINYIELRGIDLNISPDSFFCLNSGSNEFRQLFIESDGIIFTGGADIPPELYHEKTRLSTEIESYGRLYELSFLYHLAGGRHPLLDERKGYLVFCICLGLQNLNVALGGTLFQEIPEDIYGISNVEDVLKLPATEQHRNYQSEMLNRREVTSYIFHPVKIVPGSFLDNPAIISGIIEPEVMSSHHQCIKNLGAGLRIAATSEDGKVIEAVSHEKFPYLFGVQFHPEKRYLYDGSTLIFSDDKQVTAKEKTNQQSLQFNRELWKYLSECVMKSK